MMTMLQARRKEICGAGGPAAVVPVVGLCARAGGLWGMGDASGGFVPGAGLCPALRAGAPQVQQEDVQVPVAVLRGGAGLRHEPARFAGVGQGGDGVHRRVGVRHAAGGLGDRAQAAEGGARHVVPHQCGHGHLRGQRHCGGGAGAPGEGRPPAG